MTLDCVDDALFDLRDGCACKKPGLLSCLPCSNRLQLLDILTWREYYSSEESNWRSHFRARVVLLNKKYPAVPEHTEYRPIIVTSPVVKYLEGIVMEHLRKYAVTSLHRAQYGFCPQIGIDECKFDVFREAMRRKKEEPATQHCALFVDYSSAYDRVDRNRLYAYLEARSVLPPYVLQLLKFLHHSLEYTLGAESCRASNGVPQGMTTSPMLFDIYTECLLQ